MKKYFFIPKKGANYESGLNGIKTLVLGSHFYCPYADCPHLKEACASSSSIRTMDDACPCYTNKGDRDYYKLSNSNEIEIESYLEGFPYPSYDAFTYLMLDKRDHLTEQEKRDFWEQVAFTNYIQHYWPDGYTPPYNGNEPLFDADYEAFKEVLDELKPQIVIVWNEAIRDCLQEHNELQYIGMMNMPIISAYLFACYGAEQRSNPKLMKTLLQQYTFVSEKLNAAWLKALLVRSFNDPHAVDKFQIKTVYEHSVTTNPTQERGYSSIKDIVTLLKQCATRKLIVRKGNRLDFSPGFSRMHKEIFMELIKEHFDVPSRINIGLTKMFGYEPGHYQISKHADDDKIKKMKSVFDRVKKKRKFI